MRSICSVAGCGETLCDRAHLRTKGQSELLRQWDKDKWIPICRIHHVEQHTIGIITFCYKYNLLGKLQASGFPKHKILEWHRRQKCKPVTDVVLK